MRKSESRLSIDMEYMTSGCFEDICRNHNPRILIRKRKMPIFDLLLSMITRKATSLALELRNYMKISHPGTQISKPGYLKQRMKLNPEAFKHLFQYHLLLIHHVHNFGDEIGQANEALYLTPAVAGSFRNQIP